jgi:hypothetical protein
MTGATTWSFNENLGDDPAAANGEIVSRMHDFSDLDGATDVYIAFRHHDTPDGQWFISFDDVVLDTTLGIEDNSFAGFKLFVDTQHVLQLSSTNKTLDGITIYNLLGQHILSNKLTSTKASIDLSVLNGKITNNTHVIEANTLANGIYIIELKDNTSNAVIRKKIVL